MINKFSKNKLTKICEAGYKPAPAMTNIDVLKNMIAVIDKIMESV